MRVFAFAHSAEDQLALGRHAEATLSQQTGVVEMLM
jgi:hypothetical protein